MKKIFVLCFTVICIILATTITTIAAEKEKSSYSWEETTPGSWQVRDTTNNVYVKNAIIQEKAGPGYYYYIILDGKMMTEDNTYLGVPLMVNRDHDGAFGRLTGGAEELVAQHPELVICMDAAAQEATDEIDLTRPVNKNTYEQNLALFGSLSEFDGGRWSINIIFENGYVITKTGKFYDDFVSMFAENGDIEFRARYRTDKFGGYVSISLNNPTGATALQHIKKLH